MRVWFKYSELILLLLCAVFFLLHPQSMTIGADRGLDICRTAVLPTLFPFFILTNIWVSSGWADRLARLTAPIMGRLLHLPGSASAPFILGSIGGYPVGAATVSQLYQGGQLSRKQAEQTLCICNNAGPAFIIGVVGVGVFSNLALGVCLYLIHVVSALLVGILLRPADPKMTCGAAPSLQHHDPPIQRWTQAIRNAGTTALQVCIFILFFAIVNQCITDGISGRLTDSSWFLFLMGTLELAGGCHALADAPWALPVKMAAAAFLIGWGGVCVQLQSLSILQQAGLSGRKMVIRKIFQGIISAITAVLLAPLFSSFRPCTAATEASIGNSGLNLLLIILILLFSALFLKESTGNAGRNRI